MNLIQPVSLCRSVLSVPAINDRAMAKIGQLDADIVIVDLEDSVPPERKAEARVAIAALMARRPDATIIIRVNDGSSEWFAEDVALVASLAPDAVLLPKVQDPRDLARLADLLAEAGGETIPLWAMMETPKAFLNAAAIAEAARGLRLTAMVAGLNDLRKATGIRALPERRYLTQHLSSMVLAGRAYGLTLIDSVSNDFRDLEAFAAECRTGAEMGFDGKMLIHPAQIGPANDAFSPWPEDLDRARRIVAAFAVLDAERQGVINIDGEMVERLHLDEARALLARHDEIVTRTRSA